MIKSKDIFKAVVTALNTKFPAVTVYDTETEEGFKPECFYVELTNPVIANVSGQIVSETMNIIVTFFPTSKKDLVRLFEVKEALQEAFYMSLQINDNFIVPIMAQAFEFTTNKCLEMTLSLATYQRKTNPLDKAGDQTKPMMETLHEEQEVNG